MPFVRFESFLKHIFQTCIKNNFFNQEHKILGHINNHYSLLNAEFLAAAQVLIYVGAIAILIIFAVMLTQNVAQGNPSNKFRIPMALGVSLFAAFIIIAITGMDWNLITEANLASATQDAVNAIVKDNPAGLASILLNNYVLPFPDDGVSTCHTSAK